MTTNFQGIKPGDRVLYTTPQGGVGAGIAQFLLCYCDRIVVNAGGPHGRPVVVNESNYLRHVPKRERAPVMRAGG